MITKLVIIKKTETIPEYQNYSELRRLELSRNIETILNFAIITKCGIISHIEFFYEWRAIHMCILVYIPGRV